jgi:hypothetical protein
MLPHMSNCLYICGLWPLGQAEAGTIRSGWHQELDGTARREMCQRWRLFKKFDVINALKKVRKPEYPRAIFWSFLLSAWTFHQLPMKPLLLLLFLLLNLLQGLAKKFNKKFIIN